ncbi:hypothetical protein N9063_00355 [Deltaproteobacteria bacterium]|nr:hypothetical protein [Deltaproteobacteria bacterium]
MNMLKRLLKYSLGRKVVAASEAIPPLDIYNTFFNTLNPDHLGYGRDVHSPKDSTHWSPAYAMIVSAEVVRKNADSGTDGGNDRLKYITDSARWLLDNIGCASTIAPLWTLPYPRKIWEDTEPVKEGTGFCIPSSHAIQAMCEVSQEPNVNRDLADAAGKAALNAACYYAKNCFDGTEDGVVFWYSSLMQHSFHVTNATSMISGQLQRVASLNPGQEFLSSQADRAVKQLLMLKFDADGSWGWNYFGNKIPSNKENRTNDLLHEAFVCNGLLDYKQYDGKYGGKYTYSDLHDTLCRFYRDGDIYEYSEAEARPSRRRHLARSLAMGHALYVASRLERVLERPKKIELSQLLYQQFTQKYVDGDKLFYRPDGEDVACRVRVVGHVLLGLAEYHANLNNLRVSVSSQGNS